MKTFADRLLSSIREKRTPCVVGLDPRVECMPKFVVTAARRRHHSREALLRACIAHFHSRIIRIIAHLVPGVKLQSAFYEQYGVAGVMALEDTIREARKHGLLVIVDVKRNDIATTAEAYARAFLGETTVLGFKRRAFPADAITVSPYLGHDSLVPFVDACEKYGNGVFILVKTSNSGSPDLQGIEVATGSGKSPLYMSVATMVNRLAGKIVGDSGYSSIGAVVGATFPGEAAQLRALMPRCIFLVPGYGVQGGRAEDAARCFNKDGLGAIVNASRSITYNLPTLDISEPEFEELVRERVIQMICEIEGALGSMAEVR